ncbi:MAG: 3-5 exoribonuclease [Solirubrobacterales bacterium]|jgi:3'-5' exoribonuclease|nr:3-5 exoribonuclease [Solirubrobacterales bacterium]
MEAARSKSHLEVVAGAGPTIAELRPGQRFEGRFACARKDRMSARNGASYLALELRDRSGTITARAFREADRLAARFERGDAVEVRGRAERYRGELQVEVDDVRKLEPGEFEPGQFLPSAYRDREELEGFFEHLAREIHDPGLRGLVDRVVSAPDVAKGLRRAPCTRGGHHAYLGGLLEHTVAVGTMVGELCVLHPRLDSDLLMAAALLHDIGKVREFSYGAEIELSDEGRMLGHLAIGAEIIGSVANGLPAERRLQLLHCVLSHHGAEAGGRGRAPATPEAIALQRLNALDAQVKGALEHGALAG